MLWIIRILVVCMAPAVCAWGKPAAADCASLARLKLADTKILAAELVSGPTFTPPRSPTSLPAGEPKPLENLPAFCRVSAVIAPAVHFELWLPLATWNGKFNGTGNGGYNGSVVYFPLAEGVRRGYATASTDMGHVATPDHGEWALGHPELVIDQAYRAQHETAVKSKQIVRAFYGTAPRRSYFTGCSSGGWQGLTEAQRFPQDYDGIVAGAPAIDVINLHAATIWNHEAVRKIEARKFRMVTDAVLAKCDVNDGVKDGLLEDPRRCNFVPSELACKVGQDSASCLLPEEVSALQKIHDGARFSSGEQVYPGFPRGLEYSFAHIPLPMLLSLATSTFKYMVFQNPGWDYRSIDFDRDVRHADAKIGAIVNGNSPDLRAFRQAGGKLILYHGWDDALISALNTVRYYDKVAAFFAGARANEAAIARVQDFARLFLMPGVGHCAGGPGPSTFDGLAALEKWVEQGTAPERIPASHTTQGVVDRTRPLCPYPKLAVHTGGGSIDDAENFVCRAQGRPER